MKYVLSMSLVISALSAAPAFGDGDVPRSVLKQLGLADLEVMSDQEGSEVRGEEGAVAMGASNVIGLVIDPLTKAFIFGSDVNTTLATGDKVAAQTQASGVGVALSVGSFSGFLIGGAGGSSGAGH